MKGRRHSHGGPGDKDQGTTAGSENNLKNGSEVRLGFLCLHRRDFGNNQIKHERNITTANRSELLNKSKKLRAYLLMKFVALKF